MDLRRKCLLLATEYDLEIEARWISTKENALADALSGSDYDRIGNLVPQLIFPTCSHRNHGFLTYNSRGSHQSLLITYGEAQLHLLDATIIPYEHPSSSFVHFAGPVISIVAACL